MPMKLCRWDGPKRKKSLQYKTQRRENETKFPNSKLKKIPQKRSKKFAIFGEETLGSALNVDKSLLDAMVIIFSPTPFQSYPE